MESWVSVQRGFFDLDERYAALSAAGDPLEKLGRLIDFELFRPIWMPRFGARTAARAAARRWTR